MPVETQVCVKSLRSLLGRGPRAPGPNEIMNFTWFGLTLGLIPSNRFEGQLLTGTDLVGGPPMSCM